MRSNWWKFNECMTSGTRPLVRYIRWGEEGVTTSDLGPSENQAMFSSTCFNICFVCLLNGVYWLCMHSTRLNKLPK